MQRQVGRAPLRLSVLEHREPVRPADSICVLLQPEHGRTDVPTFYTCDEGLSSLTQEGMLAQSVAQQFHMAGVRTEDTKAEFEGRHQTRDGASEARMWQVLRLLALFGWQMEWRWTQQPRRPGSSRTRTWSIGESPWSNVCFYTFETF